MSCCTRSRSRRSFGDRRVGCTARRRIGPPAGGTDLGSHPPELVLSLILPGSRIARSRCATRRGSRCACPARERTAARSLLHGPFSHGFSRGLLPNRVSAASRDRKAPRCGAFFSAPKRTRTSTGLTSHKALNLVRSWFAFSAPSVDPVVIGLFGGSGGTVALRNRGDAPHRPSHRATYQSRASRPRTSGDPRHERSIRLTGRAASVGPPESEPRSTGRRSEVRILSGALPGLRV
jgi:hypothetical protein